MSKEAAKEAAQEAAQEAREAAALRGLAAHLLEKWEVPEALHAALSFVDGPPISEAAHRASRAFLAVHAGAGSGATPVLDGLRTHVSPAISKAAAKAFVKGPEGGAVGGGAEVGDGAISRARSSRLG